ncbi:G-patch domain-containing protein [Phlyctema vagabunda]|uniref:PinX1-related protein 1 n=1 Tax=Phlyctema vagabunda TaxID=108571 RepID=A0ABR4P3D2_9HELO
MGLAGPKKQNKISSDPNNTKWTRDATSFGHKIMTSQGWTPGELLGAQDAAHAEFHTAANASHIRVVLKDDNLGLGAKIGSGLGTGECTGLDVFQTLLGRLNGRDEEEMEKEQKSREDLKRAIYTEQKWGSIRFVRGGFLIGDKIQELIDGEEERVRKLAEGTDDSSSDSDSSSGSEDEVPVVEEPKKSKKKRKAEVLEDPVPELAALKVKKTKKSRKSEAASEDSEAAATATETKKSKKKSKKHREQNQDEENSDEVDAKRRKKEKKEKKARKEKARLASTTEDAEAKAAKKKAKREKRKGTSDEEEVKTDSTPASTGRSTPIMMQGRHAVRSRNIAAKRLAGMDLASLNQIFMIKSQT